MERCLAIRFAQIVDIGALGNEHERTLLVSSIACRVEGAGSVHCQCDLAVDGIKVPDHVDG